MSDDESKRRGRIGELAAVAVFLMAAGAVARHTIGLRPSHETAPYHASVRNAIEAAPKAAGEWVGIEIPMGAQAQSLLRPTAYLGRRYVNTKTGETCMVTIVHCRDARDMLDHYPPNCYPGQGWVLRSAEPVEVEASFRSIEATEYHFSRGRFGASSEADVTNAMLLPNGKTSRDMSGIEEVMGGQDLRFLGPGQLQVFFDQAIAKGRRREIVREMIDLHRPSIEAILRSTSATGT